MDFRFGFSMPENPRGPLKSQNAPFFNFDPRWGGRGQRGGRGSKWTSDSDSPCPKTLGGHSNLKMLHFLILTPDGGVEVKGEVRGQNGLQIRILHARKPPGATQ